MRPLRYTDNMYVNRRWIAAFVSSLRWLRPACMVLWLAGCATAPLPPAKPPAVNLSGFTPEFRGGYNDGCASVNAERRRDEARYKTDAQYAQGWRDGYDICRRRQ